MEYTLAFSNVKTVAVFRSRPRSESRISIEGLAASSARIPDSYTVVSRAPRREDVTNGMAYIIEVADQFCIFVQNLLLQRAELGLILVGIAPRVG
jgi:hypothetical protein